MTRVKNLLKLTMAIAVSAMLLMITAAILPSPQITKAAIGGSGTQTDPYTINSAADLA